MTTKTISRKEYNILKKMRYIERGKDGIERGLFRTKHGTTSIPVKVRKVKRK